MAITINHTGRRKLDRNEFKITMLKDGLEIPKFELELQLRENLPDNSRIIVEAHTGNITQRFDFGTTRNFEPPLSTELSSLPVNVDPQFRVMVVDYTERQGRLLASITTRAASGEDDGGSSLLLLGTLELQELVWTVQMFAGDRPGLYLNRKIPDVMQKLRTQADFQALILPAAFRTVLSNYYLIENQDDDDEVQSQWWRLSESLGGERPEFGDYDKFSEWVEHATGQFASRHKFCTLLLEDYAGLDS